MFGVYFGKYLQDIGVLTKEQYLEIIETNKFARVKMGLLAINEGLMTEEQAEKVNRMQAAEDARFGDIAVRQGYLSDDQVSGLLKKQGDSYLLFIQALIERQILTLEDIQKYINQYKKSERFTSLDLDAIKSSDVDKIIQVFIRDITMPPVIKDYIALMARNLIRFVDTKVRFEKIENINEYAAKYGSSQDICGDYDLFIGICSDGNGIKIIGEKFAREEFETIDEDVLDSTCEFINTCNGLFASKLSQEDIEVDMLPPNMYPDAITIRSEGIMYRLPCFVHGERADIVICMESKWNIG